MLLCTWLLAGLAGLFPQVSILDHGAVPNDGLDDSAALVAAVQQAASINASVEVPEGVYHFDPTVLWLPEGSDTVIVGANELTTRFVKLQNTTWTLRVRAADDTSFTLRGVALDGNRPNLPNAPGQDQHHEIRIDSVSADATMRFVELDHIRTKDLVADGVQIVHNNLEMLRASDWSHARGTAKGRRCLQFSYHPKNAIVTDSEFVDFSTEPAGGSVHRCNLILSNVDIRGNCNTQSLGVCSVTNVRANRLSSATFSKGSVVSNCIFESNNGLLFYRECGGHFSNCTFLFETDEAIGAWARFNDHHMDVRFTDCTFNPDGNPVSRYFATQFTTGGHKPIANFHFDGCVFPETTTGSSFSLTNPFHVRVTGCRFEDAGEAYVINARFGPSGSLEEHGNFYAGEHSMRLVYASGENSKVSIVADMATIEAIEPGFNAAWFDINEWEPTPNVSEPPEPEPID